MGRGITASSSAASRRSRPHPAGSGAPLREGYSAGLIPIVSERMRARSSSREETPTFS